MIKNAHNVMDLIIDETGRARKAQVGVDLTISRVSLVGKYLMTDPDAGAFEASGTVASDVSPKELSQLAKYTEIEPRQLNMFTNKVFVLERGVYSIEFEQGLKPLPANQTAMIINRSSVGRSGALIRSSIYDPGFTTPRMGALMYVFTPIKIEQYARVAQIVVMENEEADLYDGQWQGDKDKR